MDSLVKVVALTLSVIFTGCSGTTGGPEDSPEAAADGLQPEDQREGVYQYIGTLKGQSWLGDGKFVFLYGLSNGSAPMTGEAGTYTTSNDTFTHTIIHSSDPSRSGLVFKWTTDSMAGDTTNYVVMDQANTVTGRGKMVKID